METVALEHVRPSLVSQLAPPRHPTIGSDVGRGFVHVHAWTRCTYIDDQRTYLAGLIQRGLVLRKCDSLVPQAWAAGSIFYLVQAILGLRGDAPANRLLIDPQLPR